MCFSYARQPRNLRSTSLFETKLREGTVCFYCKCGNMAPMNTKCSRINANKRASDVSVCEWMMCILFKWSWSLALIVRLHRVFVIKVFFFFEVCVRIVDIVCWFLCSFLYTLTNKSAFTFTHSPFPHFECPFVQWMILLCVASMLLTQWQWTYRQL